MFTGIVETTGRVGAVEVLARTRRIRIDVEGWEGALSEGDSVAVDGACLTAVALHPGGFAVDVIGTTLERTIAGTYTPGHRVNLERALRMGDRLDGHLVQGHVDGIGHLIQIVQEGEFWLMDVEVPGEILDVTVVHGSIAINGVSLTVSELPAPGVCRIGLIPYTYEHTNLGSLRGGDPVNIEGDMIGKFVARVLETRGAVPRRQGEDAP